MKMASVQVTGYLHTQQLRKARSLLKKLTSILELELANANVEAYQGDPQVSRFNCKLAVSVESQRAAYFDFLERFGRIASGRLSVTAPSRADGTHRDFDIAVPRTSISGVDGVDVSVVSS